MNNILIINLRRIGDVFSSSHLINSIKEEMPSSSIDILVFEDTRKAAENLNHIATVHTIKRKDIEFLRKAEPFSDGLSLQCFINDIQTVKEKKWELVINYSNDPCATYLTSYLGSNHAGIKMSHYNTPIFSNIWSTIFNDVITSLKYSPIHFVDCYHNIAEVKRAFSGERIKTNRDHNEAAFKNISFIRSKQRDLIGSDIKIIGIQLSSSSSYKSLKSEIVIELIDKMINTNQYFPILLISPSSEDKKLATEINAHFNNSLVTAEADLLAISSVLLNIDALVTPDTSIKHLADLTDTPVVEVSLGFSPLFKQGSINSESVILTPRVDMREFSEREIDNNNSAAEANSFVKSSDIIEALNVVTLNSSCDDIRLSDNVSLYRPMLDNIGTFYSIVSGTIPVPAEFSRVAGRIYLHKLLSIEASDGIYEYIQRLPRREVLETIEKEKVAATATTKKLLGALRSLLQVQESSTKAKDFVHSLDILLQDCSSNMITAIPTLIFRAQVEALPQSAISESIKSIEKSLYELKSNLQKVFSTLKSIEDFYTRSSKSREVFSKEKAVRL